MSTAQSKKAAASLDPVERTRRVGERYFEAWVARDIERILSLHTQPDMSWKVHGLDGISEWKGIDAVREMQGRLDRRDGDPQPAAVRPLRQ